MPELIRVSGHDNPQRRGDVVFVHGLNGNPRDYWGAPGSHWPEWLGEALPEVGVWSLGYENAAFKKRTLSLLKFFSPRGFAMPLTDRAKSVLLTLELNGIGGRPLVFITHSMGGLLVKQLLRTANDGPPRSFEQILLGNTRGVCFIATPHIGSDLAKYANYFRMLLGTNVSVSELQPHESRLRELQEWYGNFVTRDEVRISTISFYEMKPTTGGVRVVEPGDANPGIPNAGNFPLDDDHRTICKPKSRNSDIHLKTIKFIQNCINLEASDEEQSNRGFPDRSSDLSRGWETASNRNDVVQGRDNVVTGGFGRLGTHVELATVLTIGSALDPEIDEAELHLKGHDRDRAQFLFERIKQQHWDELTRQQKFRVRVGLANVALARGQDHEAGRMLRESKDIFPESERAQINEVLGLEFTGNPAEAHALAVDRLKTYPSESKLVAAYIRTAPPDSSLEDLAAVVPQIHERDAEVCAALSMRAMRLHRFEEAEAHARTAVASSPDWFGAHFLLGQALLNAQSTKLVRYLGREQGPPDAAKLQDAVKVMDDAIVIANRQRLEHLIADSLVIRALAKMLRGEGDSAEEDFLEALRRDNGHAIGHHRFAVFLAEHGRNDEAISHLRKSLEISHDVEAEFFLANLLAAKKTTTEKDESLEIFIRLSTSKKGSGELDAGGSESEKARFLRAASFHFAVEMLVKSGQFDDANSLLETVPPDRFGPLSLRSARSKLLLARGEREASSSLADEALRYIAEDSSVIDLRSLAILLDALGRHEDALPIWLRVSSTRLFDYDSHHLVRCAESLGRQDVVLDVAKAAREAGVEDPWLFYKEVLVLEHVDVNAAIELLETRLKDHPDDKHARMMLSYVGLRWERADLIDARLEALPSVEEASPAEGELVVDILRRHGDSGEALCYAYELVRRHPDEPEANAALIRVFFDPSSKPLPEMVVSGVGVGTAVRYEEADGREEWAIIEDSPNPRLAFNEYPPTHQIARALEGSHVGETVTLTKTSGRDRTAIIKEIMPKYVRRLHVIIRDWQLKFPDAPFVQVFHVKGTDPATGEDAPDFTDLKLLAEKRFVQANAARDLYRDHLIPLHVLAHCVGCDPFFAVHLAASDAELPIRSNRGGDAELAAALDVLRSNQTLVLDLTALAMVSLLQLEGLLRHWPGKLVISQSTASELRSTRWNLANKAASIGHYGKTEKGYYLQPIPSEVRQSHFDSFSSFVDTVLEVCDVRGCPALAGIDPEQRNELVDAFGRYGLESILLARDPGHALWTDDITVGDTASTAFGVRRIWIQPFLDYCTHIEILEKDDYQVAAAKLVGINYWSASFNPGVAIKSGSMASWDAENWPFNKMLEQLANPSLSQEHTAAFAFALMTNMHKEALLFETRQATFIRILEQLATRKHGLVLVEALLTLLPKVFGVNVLAAKEYQDIGRAWLDVARRRPRFKQSGSEGLILDADTY